MSENDDDADISVEAIVDALRYRMMGLYDARVLGPYKMEPHKYTIKGDGSDNDLEITEAYFQELKAVADQQGQFIIDEIISINFCVCRRKNGESAIAIYLRNLENAPLYQQQRWLGFKLDDSVWLEVKQDENFVIWFRRYMRGVWGLPGNPLFAVARLVRLINGMTNEVLGAPLFKYENIDDLLYPRFETMQGYQDAHRDLYKYLLDGLNKPCIELIAQKLTGQTPVIKYTREALVGLLPTLGGEQSSFKHTFDKIVKQRGQVSHEVGAPDTYFKATELFREDLRECIVALEELKGALEGALGVKVEKAAGRFWAKQNLPKFGPPQFEGTWGAYSLSDTEQAVGKTVASVEFGSRKAIKDVHASELLIINFTDGSRMAIETHTNAGNFATRHNALKAEDFDVSFVVHWVPPALNTQSS